MSWRVNEFDTCPILAGKVHKDQHAKRRGQDRVRPDPLPPQFSCFADPREPYYISVYDWLEFSAPCMQVAGENFSHLRLRRMFKVCILLWGA